MLETTKNVNRILTLKRRPDSLLFEGHLKKILVQIYEVQTPKEAEALALMGVDHIGSVLTAPIFRKGDTLSKTMSIVSACGRRSSLIPLFRDPDEISRAIDHYRPDIIHFCEVLTGNGNGDCLLKAFERQRIVRDRFQEIQIMRSVPIAEEGMAERIPTLAIAKMFEPISDFFLTDTLMVDTNMNTFASQPVDGFIGITGKSCDWTMARTLVRESGIPVILAGGISPDNVSDGLARVNPAGIDSCTLTNAVDENGKYVRFQKDLEKVKLLVENVRRKEAS